MSSTTAVEAAQARVAEIRAQIAALAPTRPSASMLRGGATDFRAALATAMGDSAGTATVTLKSPGDYGPILPPAELQQFGNGAIPTDHLLPVGDGTERLHGPAAVAFRRMTEAAWRAGVDLKVNDGYRTLEQQHVLADELGLYRDGGLAAVPGTSTHGWGLSVDVDTDSPGTVDWLRANAAQFGFVEDVPGEPWHWTYRPDGS